MLKSVRKLLDSSLSLSRSRRMKDTLDIVLDTCTAWSLSITLDLTISASDARVGRSVGRVRRHGICRRHFRLSMLSLNP